MPSFYTIVVFFLLCNWNLVYNTGETSHWANGSPEDVDQHNESNIHQFERPVHNLSISILKQCNEKAAKK